MRILIFLLIPLITMGVSSCGTGPDVKVYSSQPDKGGLVRLQENEIIPYLQTKDYLCLNPSDAEALLNYCFSPSNKTNKGE